MFFGKSVLGSVQDVWLLFRFDSKYFGVPSLVLNIYNFDPVGLFINLMVKTNSRHDM